MITMNERKMLITSMQQVHRFALPNERDTRKAISELALDDIFYIPMENHVYKRVYNLENLNDKEVYLLNKYLDKEIKSAIKLFRRMNKLKKFMTSEQIKMLQGELF